MTAVLRIPLARARAHWARAQGVSRPVAGPLVEVVRRTGWLRALGGIEVYLAARARVPGLRRADLDGAVDRSELPVIPAVRGCIYLVPRAEAALALRTAEAVRRPRAERERQKAGIRPGELEAVRAALRGWPPLDGRPAQGAARRDRVQPGRGRQEGRHFVHAAAGAAAPRTHREGGAHVGGCLGTKRYLWRRPTRSPFADARVPQDPTERHAQLTEVFFLLPLGEPGHAQGLRLLVPA